MNRVTPSECLTDNGTIKFIIGNQFTVTNNAATENNFYRLKSP
jgi:hypothetical protein